jgi:hypothetical protein
METIALLLGLWYAPRHICCARQHQVERVEGLSKDGGPQMAERCKDILAGLLLPALIAGMLLGGWVLLRVMGH